MAQILIHGLGTLWIHFHTGKNQHTTRRDADTFTNPDPFLAISGYCISAAFTNMTGFDNDYTARDCLAEHMLCNTPNGAFAYIGATQIAYGGSYEYYFWDAFFGTQQERRIGVLMAAGSESMAEFRYGRLSTHLLGDPEIRLHDNEGMYEGKAFIASPAQGTTAAGTVQVNGTASGKDFQSFSLIYYPKNAPENTVTIAQGTTRIVNGNLGALDTAALAEC